MIKFNSLKDFIEHRTSCILCGNKLSCQLIIGKYYGKTPLYSESPEFKEIGSSLTDDEFVFNIQYTSPYISMKEKCKMSIIDNSLILENSEKTEAVKIVWETLSPDVELWCAEEYCKHNYQIVSSILRLSSQELTIGSCYTNLESFSIDNLWVLVDRNREKLSIYSVSNPEAPPINAPFLDINPENKEKMFDKIKTIVNFS